MPSSCEQGCAAFLCAPHFDDVPHPQQQRLPGTFMPGSAVSVPCSAPGLQVTSAQVEKCCRPYSILVSLPSCIHLFLRAPITMFQLMSLTTIALLLHLTQPCPFALQGQSPYIFSSMSQCLMSTCLNMYTRLMFPRGRN